MTRKFVSTIKDWKNVCAAQEQEIAQLTHDVESLHNVLRNRGWGQGEIDSAVCIEDDIALLKAEIDRLKRAIAEYLDAREAFLHFSDASDPSGHRTDVRLLSAEQTLRELYERF